MRLMHNRECCGRHCRSLFSVASNAHGDACDVIRDLVVRILHPTVPTLLRDPLQVHIHLLWGQLIWPFRLQRHVHGVPALDELPNAVCAQQKQPGIAMRHRYLLDVRDGAQASFSVADHIAQCPGHVEAGVLAFCREHAVVVEAVENYPATSGLDSLFLFGQVRFVVVAQYLGLLGVALGADDRAAVAHMSNPDGLPGNVVVRHGARRATHAGVQPFPVGRIVLCLDLVLRGLKRLFQRILRGHPLLPALDELPGQHRQSEVRNVVAVRPVPIKDAIPSELALHGDHAKAVLVRRFWLEAFATLDCQPGRFNVLPA
mmetsp:Transcript_92505/g.260856  ORF Transcript_92505/g.260856 Transcript_92505/m.260856 type:complete len:316 (+) Transcript_92505:43-990(+)